VPQVLLINGGGRAVPGPCGEGHVTQVLGGLDVPQVLLINAAVTRTGAR
jgi:hypothetical protein